MTTSRQYHHAKPPAREAASLDGTATTEPKPEGKEMELERGQRQGVVDLLGHAAQALQNKTLNRGTVAGSYQVGGLDYPLKSLGTNDWCSPPKHKAMA